MAEERPETTEPKKPLTGKQQYNVISDTVVGVNVRWKDNPYGLAIVAFTLIGAAIGAFTIGGGAPWWAGALKGGEHGMFVGLIISGIAFGIYHAVKHARGEHD